MKKIIHRKIIHRKAKPIETNEKCNKGCGNQAKFKTIGGILICEQSVNSCPAIKKKNSMGLKKAYTENRKNCSQFNGKRGWRKGKTAVEDRRIISKYNPDDIWGIDKKGPHKKILLKEKGNKCENCGNTEWLGKPISIEMHHINGNSNDNRKNNLQLLCPNCHSQTPTWKSKQRKNNTDIEIINAWVDSGNMSETVEKLGYKSGGGRAVVKEVLIRHKLLSDE